MKRAKKPLVVSGTSVATDYLKDTGERRFWPVASSSPPVPLSKEDEATLRDFLEATKGTWIIENEGAAPEEIH